METIGKKTIFIFTFLLFAVSSIALDPAILPGSDAIIPADKPESKLEKTQKATAIDRLPESETTQTFYVRKIDPKPLLIFSRSHPIQRIPLRFGRRNPCRKFKNTFMIPTTRSYGNDMMLMDKRINVDVETLGDPIPTKWLEFKHKYGNLHRHHHYHHHNDDDTFEKKREQKGGFMRRVRKFLKHTFD